MSSNNNQVKSSLCMWLCVWIEGSYCGFSVLAGNEHLGAWKMKFEPVLI